MKRFGVLVAIGIAFGLAFGVACGGRSSPTDSKSGGVASTIRDGQWGGEHISLQAASTGAVLDFDCAHGSIPAPLSVGADGRFRLPGVFVREHGGPVVIGEPEDSQPANYLGTIQGSTMTLSIELTRDMLSIGPYVLELSKPGRITKCL